MINSLPRWKHDCEVCRFLGTMDNYDLYHHPGNLPVVIARFGDDGASYHAALGISTNPQIIEARKRAKMLKLPLYNGRTDEYGT